MTATPTAPYFGPAEEQMLGQFGLETMRSFTPTPLKDEVWHYTSAEGLIGMIQTGAIWTTQVACLNDRSEHRYLAELVHRAVKPLALTHEEPAVRQFLAVADRLLGQIDLSGYGRLIACFTAGAADDLAQWRGYGGGECGYAIAFRTSGLLEVVRSRPQTMLLPVAYIDDTSPLPQQIIGFAIAVFQHLARRGRVDIEALAGEVLERLSHHLSIPAAAVKQTAFASELEYRLLVSYQKSDQQNLIFRQRRTLLSRHLPVSLVPPGSTLMPITRVMVGPSPAASVSKISVGDLLEQRGYLGVLVEVSKIPYRVP